MPFVPVAFLVGVMSAAQQPQAVVPIQPPSTVAIQQVIALVQAPDTRARRDLFAEALSKSALKDSVSMDHLLDALRRQGAPYQVVKVDSAGRHALVHLKSGRAGRTVVVDIASDREDPAHVRSIDVLESHATALDEVSFQLPAGASDSAVSAVLAQGLERLTAAHAFSGVVLVLKHDKPLLARGFGYANLEDSIPNRPETRFSLASMGKMFTATAILQLVDAGKLRLDDTLARVLPRYPNADRAARITIRNLLEHSAGLGDIWSTPRKPVAGLTGALAYAGDIAYPPLQFTPGSRWSYSNEGYAVLAAVVEELSGETFQDYLQRHVFAPAGMVETSMHNGADDIVPHRAVGYRPADDDPLGVSAPRANWSFIKGAGAGGAGGGSSTVSDIARFGRALREGRLISAESQRAMWTGRWDVPGFDGERYGLGSFVQVVGDKTIVGHGGGGTGSGMDNGFRQFTDGSYTVVVLTNIDPPSGTRVTSKIVRFLATLSAPALGAQ